MEIKTFRAQTMQAALDMVRHEMGMDATVLHTRELNRGLWHRLWRGRQYEIAASHEAPARPAPASLPRPVAPIPPAERNVFPSQTLPDPWPAENQLPERDELQGLVQQLEQRTPRGPDRHLPESLFQIYTDMIESDIDQQLAQQLLARLQTKTRGGLENRLQLQAELIDLLEQQLPVSGAIQLQPGQSRLVALVGPTGVGKTTTIAKLAANYRLRENQRVGLITVDTYRIAAVEQLRTYADIIDLPMEVVSTPREMREAVARMQDLDLVLMDTAGRSPRDEVKIQELKSMLAEAAPDEVHLVLSAVAGTRSLVTTAQKFAAVGTTAMLITKLDEATCLGNLLGLTEACQLPISYLTDGQNVPDDIEVAQAKDLAERVVG